MVYIHIYCIVMLCKGGPQIDSQYFLLGSVPPRNLTERTESQSKWPHTFTKWDASSKPLDYGWANFRDGRPLVTFIDLGLCPASGHSLNKPQHKDDSVFLNVCQQLFWEPQDLFLEILLGILGWGLGFWDVFSQPYTLRYNMSKVNNQHRTTRP